MKVVITPFFSPLFARKGMALAFAKRYDSAGSYAVFFRRGATRFLFPRARIMHELLHVQDWVHGRPEGSYIDDAGHHPWWHFCVRSKHAIRVMPCPDLTEHQTRVWVISATNAILAGRDGDAVAGAKLEWVP